jgi:hypothetical protein
MPKQLYLVVEHFRNEDAVPIYRRFRVTEGLTCISSWIDEKLKRCYQVTETPDRVLLDEWMANWNDIMEFEVYPVITPEQAVEKIAPLL